MKEALANVLLSSTQEILEGEFMQLLLKRGTKFENWLQVELARHLSSNKEFTAVHMEGSAENGQAIDLKCQLADKSCVGIEIKLYVCGKAVSDTRKSIKKDIEKLQQLPHGGYVLVVVYGYKSQKGLSNALVRVEEALKSLNTYKESTEEVDLYLARVEGV